MTNQTPTSEYLQRQLIDMVELAKHSGTNAVEFVQAQAPDVVRQVLVWGMAEAITVMVFSLLFLLFCFFLTRKAIKDEWDEVPIIIGILDVVGGIFVTVVFISATMDLVKILVAPKLYLLQYMAQLFK